MHSIYSADPLDQDFRSSCDVGGYVYFIRARNSVGENSVVVAISEKGVSSAGSMRVVPDTFLSLSE